LQRANGRESEAKVKINMLQEQLKEKEESFQNYKGKSSEEIYKLR
jgi:hypothetical protein